MIEESSNKMLSEHLKTSEKIEEITVAVYSMGKAIAKLLHIKADATDRRKKKSVIESPGGNRKRVTNIRAQHIIRSNGVRSGGGWAREPRPPNIVFRGAAISFGPP